MQESTSRTGSPCAASASAAPPRHRARVGPEDGERRPLPEKHADVDLLGEAREKRRGRRAAPPRGSAASSGERNQPVRWTCDVASPMSRAIRGSASDPSTRTSTLLPSRGWKVPRAQVGAGRIEGVLPAHLPQPQPVPAADRPVDAPPDDVAELDCELVERAGWPKPSCGRRLGPPPGRRPLAAGETVGHVLPTLAADGGRDGLLGARRAAAAVSSRHCRSSGPRARRAAR